MTERKAERERVEKKVSRKSCSDLEERDARSGEIRRVDYGVFHQCPTAGHIFILYYITVLCIRGAFTFLYISDTFIQSDLSWRTQYTSGHSTAISDKLQKRSFYQRAKSPVFDRFM